MASLGTTVQDGSSEGNTPADKQPGLAGTTPRVLGRTLGSCRNQEDCRRGTKQECPQGCHDGQVSKVLKDDVSHYDSLIGSPTHFY